MIISSAPLRVSLSSSDHEPFSSRFSGAALNFCINKRVYVLIRKRNNLEETKYRISYSKTELCDDVESINLCLVKEAIKLVDVTDPLEIIYSSDCPHQLGLATSTAMSTALIRGLFQYKNWGISSEVLFDWVYRLERELCGHAGGFQDGSVIWGGINYLTGYPFNVSRSPVPLEPDKASVFADHLLLIYTGNSGDSSQALKDQLALLKCGDTLEETLCIKKLVEEMHATMLQKDFHPLDLTAPMREAWELKKKLSPNMTSDAVSFIEDVVSSIDRGAAVRLVGGGAGRGLMLCLASPESLRKIEEVVSPLKTMSVEFDWTGAVSRRVFDEF
jgi:D-glycero-alpha-D-manno-heptose-7-phosphate kinase